MADTTIHNDKVVDQHTLQAGEYARMTQSAGSGRPESFFEMLGVGPRDRVLDVACGPGLLTLDLAMRAASATGLDLTPAMLEEAREMQAKRGIDGVTWIHGDAAAMPFADELFTLVTCSAAFHHFAAPETVLSEMTRVCAPGGRVAVMDITPAAGKAAAYDELERMRDPSHGHAHSVEEFAEMARRMDLGEPIVSSKPAGPFPFAAVLQTSFPEERTRDELLELMRADALSGGDRLGFGAEIVDDAVMVTYPMSTLVWTKP